MNRLQFDLFTCAQIAVSGEIGEVIARAEYAHGETMYLLRYRSTDGKAVEQWWGESALTVASEL